MASDSLTQLGKGIYRGKRDTGFVTKRTAELHPHVERIRDTVGSGYPLVFEFKTYGSTRSVKLNIYIKEATIKTSTFDNSKMPLTVTQTGTNLPVPGYSGVQNVWYPLIYLGDLNFGGSHKYTTIINYTNYLSGTYSFKIESNVGGIGMDSYTVIDASTITTTIEKDTVLSPPSTILFGAYLYGKVSGLASGGWVNYSGAAIYDWGALYFAREIA